MLVQIFTTAFLAYDTFFIWKGLQQLENENSEEYKAVDDVKEYVDKSFVVKFVVSMMYFLGICTVLSMFFLKPVLVVLIVAYALMSILSFKFPTVFRFVLFSILFVL